MHPHGLPSTNCPDWEGGSAGGVVDAEIVNEYVPRFASAPAASTAPDIIHRLVEIDCERELRRAKREVFIRITYLFFWVAIAFNIFQAVQNSGCH